MARLRTTAALALAGLALALPAPAAHAADDSRHQGGCSFASLPDRVAGDPALHTGEVDAQVLVYSRTHGNAVAATVTCQVRVDGVLVASAAGSGVGVVAFADRLTYRAEPWQFVSLCSVVDYTSDWTPTAVDCGEAVDYEFPPRDVRNVVDFLWWTADPYVCAVLAQTAPGADPVLVTDQGDVYVNGEPLYDCPPYDIWYVPPPDPFPSPSPSGAGYNDGSTGFLTLFPRATVSSAPAVQAPSLVSTCAFSTVGGVATVTGRTVAPGADAASVGCRLEDAATGAVLYDETVTAAGGSAAVRDTVAVSGAVTVCTQGAATFGTRTDTVGRHCRPGLPV